MNEDSPYIILEKESKEDLIFLVMQYLEKGYELAGGAFRSSNPQAYYIQAMIKKP